MKKKIKKNITKLRLRVFGALSLSDHLPSLPDLSPPFLAKPSFKKDEGRPDLPSFVLPSSGFDQPAQQTAGCPAVVNNARAMKQSPYSFVVRRQNQIFLVLY